MCGLYGFIGNPDKNTQKIIHKLGVSNQIRGSDSTGIAIIRPKKYTIIKKVVSADRFYNGLYPRKKGRIDGRWSFSNIIGHTRFATRGEISKSNAHPYKVGSLVYAHNGIIRNFDTLQGTYNTHYEVDTQIIGHLLERSSDKKVFGKLVSGSLAVPYTRLDSPHILKIAVSGSPLSLATNHNGWFYSSQLNHLDHAVKVKPIELKDGYIYKLNYSKFPHVEKVKLPQVKFSYSGFYGLGYKYTK